jgi:hypothetical protein
MSGNTSLSRDDDSPNVPESFTQHFDTEQTSIGAEQRSKIQDYAVLSASTTKPSTTSTDDVPVRPGDNIMADSQAKAKNSVVSSLPPELVSAGQGAPELTLLKNEIPTTATSSLVVDEQEKSSPANNNNNNDTDKKEDAATDATAESFVEKAPEEGFVSTSTSSPSSPIVVSSSKKSRPAYKFNPSKITLRFLFANRDGLTVTVECNPSDTVGEVKGALISVWPEGACRVLCEWWGGAFFLNRCKQKLVSLIVHFSKLLSLRFYNFLTGMPSCDGGESLRLVCMGKGYLTPDTRTLEDCQIPVFKTHPTPINVSVKPKEAAFETNKSSRNKHKSHHNDSSNIPNRPGGGTSNTTAVAQVNQGCVCVIL